MKRFFLVIAFIAAMNAPVVLAGNPKDFPTPLVSSSPAELRIIQQEIYVEVPNNGAAVGGLLGVLVNQATVSNAEKRVSDIRNLLIDYNFEKQFQSAFREKANMKALIGSQEVKLFKTTYAADAVDKSAAIGKNILVIQPSYMINHKFDEISVRITVWLMDREVKSNGKIKTNIAHVRNYKYVVLLDSSNKKNTSLNENAQTAAKMGKEQFVTIINGGIDGAIDLLNQSLTQEVKAQLEDGGKIGIYDVLGEQVRATIIGKTANGQPVFYQRGTIQSLNGMNNFMTFSKSTDFGINADENSL